MKQRLLLLVLALLAIGTGMPCVAQLSQGSIAGSVKDPSGALIANVKIIATSMGTGTAYTVTSTSAGTYYFTNLNIGEYTISASLKGFKSAEISLVNILVGTTTSLSITMQVGDVSETVTVQADALTVNTELSEVADVITTKQALDLPLDLNGSVVSSMRSPEAFVFLLPGTAGPGTANGQGGTWESKISGGQNYSTEVLLDGASMYRSENGSSFDETAPSVEAISEFKVTLSSYPAEVGRTTGGIESFSTKSGTNDWHGVAYDIFKNRDLDANNWGYNYYQDVYRNNSTELADYQRPADEKNDYGLALGGPVRIPKLYNGRNKAFFFFSWEQYRQNLGGTSTSTVPTTAERGGNFSDQMTTTVKEAENPCDHTQAIYQGEIFDPTTTTTGTNSSNQTVTCRLPYAKNAIPAADLVLSSANQSIVNALNSYYPLPTISGSITNNYVYAWTYPVLDTSMSVRADYNFNSKQRVYVTYNSRDNTRKSVNPWLDNAAGQGRDQNFFTHYIRVGYDYTITPNILNHLTLGYDRTNSGNYDTGVEANKDWDSALGIKGASGHNFPYVYAWGDAGIGGTVDGDSIDNGYRLNDTLTFVKGKHVIKAGVDYRYQIFNPMTLSEQSGSIGFDPTTTAGDVNTAWDANGYASMLLGLPGYAILDAYSEQPKWLSHYYGFFVQDTFKIFPSLTLNYGLRYDVDVPRHEAHGNTSDISLTTANSGAGGLPGALVFAGKGTGRNGNVNEQWADTWHKDFGPRFGFVWAPTARNNTFSLSGGYGIIYGPLQYADYGDGMQEGFNSTPSWDGSSTLSSVFTLSNGFPSYTKPPSFDPTLANLTTGAYPANAYIAPSHGRPAMVQSWSVELQQQIVPDLILDVAYVGSHGAHLRSTFDATNSIPVNDFALGNVLSTEIGSTTAANAGLSVPYSSYPTSYTVGNALRPYPQYNGAINSDCCLENRGQSNYNALETQLIRHFKDGFNLQTSYTWSKTMTNADSSVPYFSGDNGGGYIQNVFNSKSEVVLSNQDLTNNFVISYLYELPFGKGKKWLAGNRFLDKGIGGWQIGGVQRYMSGQPISFYAATAIPGYDGSIHYQRVAGQSLLSSWARSGHYNPAKQANLTTNTYDATTNPNPYRYFNYAALTDPNAANTVASRGSYAFGNQPRTTDEIRTGKYLKEDFSIVKRTHLTEKINFRLEADLIDAFNRHVFGRPQSDGPNDLTDFGYVDPTGMIVGPRQIQFLAKFEF
ncbi:carboxypeptidase regulatory-like domain-containing protein [Telmatobacter bradus]|uniref:TonB-dependent receptor n=1 Tax=Telmatobacter bradus TaxID=474953 RepID=UPI003B43AE21